MRRFAWINSLEPVIVPSNVMSFTYDETFMANDSSDIYDPWRMCPLQRAFSCEVPTGNRKSLRHKRIIAHVPNRNYLVPCTGVTVLIVNPLMYEYTVNFVHCQVMPERRYIFPQICAAELYSIETYLPVYHTVAVEIKCCSRQQDKFTLLR